MKDVLQFLVHLDMFKAKKVYWLAQIGGWLMLSLMVLFSSLVYIENASNGKEMTMQLLWSTLIFFVLGVLLTHFMRACFLYFGWLNLKLGPLVPRAILATFVFASLMSLFNDLFNFLISGETDDLSFVNILLNTIATSMFFLLWNSVYFTFHFFQRSKEQEVNNIQLTASHNEIELKNLRSQLNPHFLFNSLNSIRALIDIDPIQAKTNVTKLSSLLRKSLILGKEQLVSLKEELAIVQDYLDLEKVRFEERVTVIQEHDPKLEDLQIPPFIIQTLVENAIKHGVSKRIEGGTIWIKSSQLDDVIVISVENEGKLDASSEKGIGIENTIRRLELQYQGKAKFSLYESPTTVIAKITLNQKS